MTLGELLARIRVAVPAGVAADAAVTTICPDSRRVGAGAVFVALRGAVVDGNTFADAALKKGALVIVSDREPPAPDLPWVQVENARVALAQLAALFHGRPADGLVLAGVTGTNGKTTVTYLIDAALQAAGRRVGLLGTVAYRVGDRLAEANRTTPESSDLQALLREMRDADCSHAVMEVSSHALALERVHGLRFDVAVFTHLTRDHLDFHGDMDGYFAAKKRLFSEGLSPAGRAVINAEDDRAEALSAASPAPVWTFAIERPADFVARDVSLGLAGTRFTVHGPDGQTAIESPLLGRFNVQNLLAAFAAARAMGVPVEAVVAGLQSLAGVPGRLERIEAGQDFRVIVDYAHTDDALKNLLETVRALQPRRLITVFGCGGDRDRTKRPLMGAVASRLSDVVVLTSDNPRSEPPESILEQIQRGMNGGRKTERHVIADRREAIARALELAGPGDAVVIAGKGHETTQTIRDRVLPFDDRQVVREELARIARGARA
ncbi:MAG: UDP-N-acetylmuramoyl-L-alanyl-D-glutamate--2,6-diaminopimelate ligase [Vicinamibacteria bacterium]|nr:UDP-N-acetylmuramoyl-L-alanyl-D-glutamate--2,6-diaminopimelate ligase [Vicinamibacteria bacterium]